MNLGAPILDVSVTTSTAGGSASSTPAPAVSIVSGGTVSALGYAPIIITKTSTNDPATAAAAAAAATASSEAQTNAAYSTATTSGSTVYVSTDRVGTNSYDVVKTGGEKFAPNVEVVINKQSGGSSSKT